MKLHHRVKVSHARRCGWSRWFWTCPACAMASYALPTLGVAQALARLHACGCDKLRELNRATAWGCRNCDGTGIVSGLDCLACLGHGWLA